MIELSCGDLLAVSNTGFVSNLIRRTTDSDVSHVAAMVSPTELIQSTSSKGVERLTLTDWLPGQNRAWVLPRALDTNAFFDRQAFVLALMDKLGDKYSLLDAILSVLPDSMQISHNRLYCVDLLTDAYRQAGYAKLLPAETLVPRTLCSKPLWQAPVQLIGKPSRLRLDA